MAKKNTSSTGGLSSLIRNAGQEARAKAEARAEQLLQVESGGPHIVVPLQPKIFNILDYTEAQWGLGMTLFPVQRFLLKLYYHIPLDNKEKSIEITDMFREEVLYHFTETEYLAWLYDQGRCNIREQDHERRELILSIGRRSGKTTLAGVVASYELYRLLNLHHPQGYYGLPPGNRIQIMSVATDKDQAGLLYNEVTGHLARCDYFKPFILSNTATDVKFRTPFDIERFGEVNRTSGGKFQSNNGKATLRVTFKSCIAKGLRGFGNIVIILDEMAHYQDNSGQASAKAIYDAITPSAAAFSPKNPEDTTKPIGPVESRIMAISSPLNKSGKFYELFRLAMTRGPGSDNLLAIQSPTWEVNPTVAPSYFRQKYHADPAVFMTEHGAQFSDRVRGWIEREQDLLECVNPALRPVEVGGTRVPHQLGIDIGMVAGKDGTAFVITTVRDDKIVLAYHELWRAGEDWRETNPHLPTFSCDYVKTLKEVERLDFDEIANWIVQLTKRFYITDGLFDRWNGLPLEQNLHKRGLKQFKSEFFTRDTTSKMYQMVKNMMFDHKLELYDYPIPKTVSQEAQVKHSPLIAELLTLQAEQFSKNLVIVKAPDQADCHDDVSDALVRAIWLSSERMSNTYMSTGTSNPYRVSSTTLGSYQMRRARAHGGFTERTVPRNLGLRFGRGRIR